MILPLDVFKVDDAKETEWLGAVESVAQALELAQGKGVGTYMLYSHVTEDRTFYVIDAQGAVRQAVLE
jgi:hypothetical protein